MSDPIYGYKRLNVEAQRRDPHSFLNWVERKIRMRRECPEISWGDWKILKTTEPGVLIMRYEWDSHSLLILHNFTPKPKAPRITVTAAGHELLVDLLAKNDSKAEPTGSHVINLPPYAYRWYRAGGVDRNVAR